MRSPFAKNNAAFLIFNVLFLFILRWQSQSNRYDFLIWNLFLAFLPLVFAYILAKIATFARKLPSLVSLALFTLWLLFYPNAPYMITDLIHIDTGIPIDPSSGDVKGVLWDSVLFFSFAMQALFFGFASIRLTMTSLSSRFSAAITEGIVAVSLLLSSFGIYLGRILRLNSWDAITHPWHTALLILDHLLPPTKNPETYITIVVFTAVQYFLIIIIRDLDTLKNQSTER